jgi:hypothetical protein
VVVVSRESDHSLHFIYFLSERGAMPKLKSSEQNVKADGNVTRPVSKKSNTGLTSKISEASNKAQMSKPQSNNIPTKMSQEATGYLDVKIARNKPLPAASMASPAKRSAATSSLTANVKPKKGLLSSLIGKVVPNGQNLDSMSIPKKKPRLNAPNMAAPREASVSEYDQQYHCGWGPIKDVMSKLEASRVAKRGAYEKN